MGEDPFPCAIYIFPICKISVSLKILSEVLDLNIDYQNIVNILRYFVYLLLTLAMHFLIKKDIGNVL